MPSESSLYNFLPIGVVLFPLCLSIVILWVSRYSERWRNGLSVLTTVITFIGVAALYPPMAAGEVIAFRIFDILPGLGLSVRVDILSFSLALISSLVWMLVAIYSIDYMSHEHNTDRYYPIFIFVLGSCLGIFMAGDLFTLFVFLNLCPFSPMCW